MRGMPRPRVLLIDALGTLLRLVDPAPALRAELADRHGVSVSDGAARAALAAEIHYYRAHLQEGCDPAALRDLRGRCAEVLRDALPSSPRLAAIPGTELVRALLGALRFEPYPDALPALSALRQEGLRVVVVSNWDCSLSEILARGGLGSGLDGVVASAAAGARKPDPAIFQSALALAGAEPEQAVHVGDSPAEDVAGARAAGVRALLLLRDPAATAPDGVPVVRSLMEVTLALDVDPPADGP